MNELDPIIRLRSDFMRDSADVVMADTPEGREVALMCCNSILDAYNQLQLDNAVEVNAGDNAD